MAQKEDGLPKSPSEPPAKEATITVDRFLRPVVSTPVLAVACILCLLLGSLLRSLLSEADFFIRLPARAPLPEGETWRELRRLLEWRIGWNRDLIIAIAHRG